MKKTNKKQTDTFYWKTNPPPKNIQVLASFDTDKSTWQLVTTCKQGCCVHNEFGSMTLPLWWKDSEQHTSADNDLRCSKSLTSNDFWKLYIE